jgi:hypothetical protein
MPPQFLRMAMRWAVLISLASGVLVAVEPRHTPQFVVSVTMLGVGLAFAALVAALTRLPRRKGSLRAPDSATRAPGSKVHSEQSTAVGRGASRRPAAHQGGLR